MNTTLCQVGADHKKLKELKGWHRTEEPIKKGQDQTNGSDDNKQENKKKEKATRQWLA